MKIRIMKMKRRKMMVSKDSTKQKMSNKTPKIMLKKIKNKLTKRTMDSKILTKQKQQLS